MDVATRGTTLPVRLPPTRWTRRREYLILVPHNAAIATIATIPIDKTLILGTFCSAERKSEVPIPSNG
jgi:hypothetical protein